MFKIKQRSPLVAVGIMLGQKQGGSHVLVNESRRIHAERRGMAALLDLTDPTKPQTINFLQFKPSCVCANSKDQSRQRATSVDDSGADVKTDGG